MLVLYIYHVHICSLLVTVFRALQLCQKLLPSQKPAIYDHLQTFLQIIHREEREQQWICGPLLRQSIYGHEAVSRKKISPKMLI